MSTSFITRSTVHEKLTPEEVEQMDREMEEARKRRERHEREAREYQRRIELNGAQSKDG